MIGDPTQNTERDPSPSESISDLLGHLVTENAPEGGDHVFVPGANHPSPGDSSEDNLDLDALAVELERCARAESSALAKSRGLLVSAQLWQHLGDKSRALNAARDASMTSPKLAVAALTFRKKSLAIDDQEAVELSLASAAASASQVSSRVHASKRLAARLIQERRFPEALKLLDHVARTGDADEALVLERISVRIHQGVSLAGIETPGPFVEAVACALELLTGKSAPAPGALGQPREPVPELHLLRAARALAAGETQSLIGSLEIAGTLGERLPELHAALLATRKDDWTRSMEVMNSIAEKSPTRSHLRALAKRGFQRIDPARPRDFVTQSLGGESAFSVEERWLLAAVSGATLELNDSEATALANDNPALALAVLGPSSPFLLKSGASESSLLAQLGAGFQRLGRSGEDFPLSENGRAALEELQRRNREPELCAALGLLLATSTGDELAVARNIGRLSAGKSHHFGRLIAGALYAHHQDTGRAEESFRSIIDQRTPFFLSGSRGLLALQCGDSLELLRASIDRTNDPLLRFAYETELATRDDVALRPLSLLQTVLSFFDTSASTCASERPALLLGAAGAAALSGHRAEAQSALARLISGTSPASELVQLLRAWDAAASKAAEQALVAVPASQDSSERALIGWLASLHSLVPVDAGGGDNLLAVEKLLRFGRGLVAAPGMDTSRLGEQLKDLDAACLEISRDLDQLSGRLESLRDLWLERARLAVTGDARQHAYERLAQLDELDENQSSELLWRQTLAESFPHSIPSLLRLEESLLARREPTISVAERLEAALPPGDRVSYQITLGAHALAHSDMKGARKYLEPLLDLEAPPLLAVRGAATIARERRDDDLLARCLPTIAELSSNELDRSTNAYETALVLSRQARREEAIVWAKLAVTEVPGSFAAHHLLHFLHVPDAKHEQAGQLAAFAHAASSAVHQTDLWFAAAQAYLDAEAHDQAAQCYENVLVACPDHRGAFEQLYAYRQAEGADSAVEALLQARLDQVVPGSDEQLDLALKLYQVLSDRGDQERAKAHLERLLSTHPNNTTALRAHAELSAHLGDYEAAEKSLVGLRDELPHADERTDVLRSLARLYEQHLHRYEKAMDALNAVLKSNPSDEHANIDLVRVLCTLGLGERATALQTELIQSAQTPEQKRAQALVLADIYERIAGDPKRAEATLERTRKAWPLDAAVLEATVAFMDRHGTGGSRGFLLDRANKDARRTLEAGRLDAALLDTLARVARLTGQPALEEATLAARDAYLGPAQNAASGDALAGAGVRAIQEQVDELLSPPGFSGPLRALLRKTGAAMDAAFSVDLANMGARRLASGASFERIKHLMALSGSPPPELFVSDSLGTRCLPIATEPPRLLVGSGLDALPEAERDFLLLRALKLRALGTGALARSKEEDRWPMLAALLLLFAPHWRPTTVDTRKVAQVRALIEQGLARVGYDDDVPVLALEVLGSIGADGATIGEEAQILANRVALVAIGDPSVALSALACCEGTRLAPGGPSRFRWIEGNPEARDLILFSTTSEYARARVSLGIAQPPSQAVRAPHSPPQLSRGAPATRTDAATGGGDPEQVDLQPPPRRPSPPRRS